MTNEFPWDYSQLRHPSTNVMMTSQLFFETRVKSRVSDGVQPIFTLKEWDHEYEGVKYYSLRRIYIEFEDPGEYDFAMAVFGSWEHWKKLSNSALLKEHVAAWREELEIKIRSKALKAAIQTATTAGSKGQASAKWLASGEWKRKPGRPSKQDIAKQARIEAGIEDDVAEDMERLGLH